MPQTVDSIACNIGIPLRQENLAVVKVKRKDNGALTHLDLGFAENRDDLPYRHTQFHPLSVLHRGQDHPKRVEPGAFVGRVERLEEGYGVLLRKPGSERAPLPLSEIQRRDVAYAE